MGKKIIIKGADFSAVAIGPSEPQRIVATQGAAGFTAETNKLALYNANGTSGGQRVKSGELSGNYTITMNEGYALRVIIEYEPSISTLTPTSDNKGLYYTVSSGTVVQTGALLSSYTYTGGKKTVLTFCKTDTSASISPSDDIGTIQFL